MGFNKNKSFSFSLKLAFGFSMIIFLIVGVIGMINNRIDAIEGSAHQVEDIRLPTSQYSQEMLNGINQSLAVLRGWMILAEEKFKQERLEVWTSQIDTPLDNLTNLAPGWTNSEDVKRLNTIKLNIEKFRKYQQDIEDIAHTSENRPALAILFQQAVPLAEEIIDAITVMIDLEDKLKADIERKKMLKMMADFRKSMTFSLLAIDNYLISKDKERQVVFDQQWDINSSSLNFIKNNKSLLTIEQQRAFERLEAARKKFSPLPKQMMTIALGEQSNLADYWLGTMAVPIAETIKADLIKLVEEQQSLLSAEFKHHHEQINTLQSIGFFTAIFTVFILTLFALYVIRLVTQPVARAVEIADEIGKGNYDVDIDLTGSSEMMALGAAFYNMKSQIQGRVLALNEKNWISENIAKVSGLTAGATDLKTMAQTVLSFLAETLGAGHAAFYLKENDEASNSKVNLDLHASYAFKECENVSGHITLGEGLVGQCAVDAKPILLTQVPDDYIRINSGLGEKQPQTIYVQPVLFEAQVLGVMEFAFFKMLTTIQQEFIQQATANIGVVINNIRNNMRTSELLKESQAQSEELQSQQEQLKVINDELESQTQKLKESEEKNHSIIESSVHPIITINSHGLIESFNPAAEKLFGYAKEEVFNKNINLLMPSPHKEEHDNYLKRYFDTGVKKAIGAGREVVAVKKDGNTVPIFLSVGEMDLSGKPYFVGMLQDISKQKRSEERINKQNEELQQQTEELRVSNEELHEQQKILKQQKQELEQTRDEVEIKAGELARASQYKSEFLANMSHELRTPLNSLLILSKMLADNSEGNLSEQQAEDARIIYEGGNDLLNLINDIMDLSKVEVGMLNINIEDIALGEVVRNIEKLFKQIATEKGIIFKLEQQEGLPATFPSDAQRLKQILKNFLANAFKFTEKGSVTLKIHRPEAEQQFVNKALTPDNTIAFSVIDTGIGIDKLKQQAIFEAFQQEDGSTSRKYGGTGLGLTISRELADLLGGEIGLTSHKDKGSVFTLYLPLQLGKELNSELEKIPAPASEANELKPGAVVNSPSQVSLEPFITDDSQHIQSGDKSVLIIEDDPKFAQALLDIVHANGFNCLVTNKGRDGIYLAEQYQPSSVLLDIGLPDISGLQVLEQLKYNLKTRHIPVHVISGQDNKQMSLHQGAFSFLSKPAEREDIEQILFTTKYSADDSIKSILVVEDDKAQQSAIERLLQCQDIQLSFAATGEEVCRKIGEMQFDCIILDLGLPDISGYEVLQKLAELPAAQLPPVVVYTGQEISDEEQRTLSQFAADIIIKGAESPERLLDDVSLFLHSVEANLPEAQKNTIRLLHDKDAMLKGRKILLIDDDMRNMYALSQQLEQAGLEVLKADNGQMAVDMLKADGAIELILMDIMMPVMDGYETMQKIRQIDPYTDIPIIVLTAKAMPEDVEKCLAVGASEYLSKPVDMEKLLSMLRIWLYRHN